METTISGSAYRLPLVTGSLFFGAAASLGNVLLVNLTFIIVNYLLNFLLGRFPSLQSVNHWFIEGPTIIAVVAIGIFGVWLGIRFGTSLLKKHRVAPVLSGRLPLISSVIFALPIVLFAVIQVVGSLSSGQGFDWIGTSYLIAQVLIFGGCVYLFLELLRRKPSAEVPSNMTAMIPTDLSVRNIAVSTLSVIGATGLIAFLHAVEAAVRLPTPIVPQGTGIFSSDTNVLLVFFALTVFFVGAAIVTRFGFDVSALKNRYKTLATHELIVVSTVFGSGLLAMVGYAGQLGFLFSPYVSLITTALVLLGILKSVLLFAQGRRDQWFVNTRIVAYVIGFFGQPTGLGVIVTIAGLLFH